jgi:type IV pilus assembly protein PilC
MKFQVMAYDRSGVLKEQTVEAGSQAEATEIVRRDGLFVSSAKPLGTAKEAAVVGKPRRPRGSRHKHVAGFMRQLSVLVGTGTPVVDALLALEVQARDPGWRAIIADVRGRVEDGAQFSEALSANPRYFDTVAQSLVRAGESGGKLDVMLNRLSELTTQQLKIRQAVTGAMVYPCLLIGVSVAVLGVMLCFVMPRFSGLFTTLGVPLPPTTKLLMGLSGFLVSYWWAVLIGVCGAAGGFVFWFKSEQGRLAFHTALVRAPYFGRIFRSFGTAQFSRLMGLLLESKVPMLEALELTRQASANIHYGRLMTTTQDALTRGESFSAALASSDLINGSVVEAIKNGERSGQVGAVLSSMADFLDEENQVLVKTLTGLLEPVILITLGVMVGLVATSMFLPLFDLTAMAGSGGGG